jgi:hypothetical protein
LDTLHVSLLYTLLMLGLCLVGVHRLTPMYGLKSRRTHSSSATAQSYHRGPPLSGMGPKDVVFGLDIFRIL